MIKIDLFREQAQNFVDAAGLVLSGTGSYMWSINWNKSRRQHLQV